MMAKYTVNVRLMCLAAIALPGPALAQADLAADLQAISASFICPEKLGSDAARKIAMDEIGRRLASRRLSYVQAQKVVEMIYGLHGCGVAASRTSVAIPGAATR